MQRSTSCDDNTCELMGDLANYVNGYHRTACEDCYGCSKENMRFELASKDNYISIGYFHRIKSLCIEPFSESIVINYCPWCGKKLTDEPVDFKKCHYGKELELMEE